jgi:enoyl-CoA hydratase/carnithine racemase
MSSVLLEINDRVAWMRLNRPEALNALDQTTVDQLDAHLGELENQPDVRVLVITGTGRAFCAGADLTGLSDIAAGDGATGLAAFLCRAGEVILQP